MYEGFYGFRERPFELTSDPRFLLLTPKHREALSNLRYGISGRRGLTLLIGEAGTGKTSIIAAALNAERHRSLSVAHLANPTLTRDEFFELLATAFGLSGDAQRSKGRFLLELEATLVERHRSGGLTALIVDEAQSLPHELLEEIRLLANIETPREKLLPVILAGQPELAQRLNEPGLRQLKQRVSLRCTLTALELRETASYIATRVRTAGGDTASVFTREAVIAIHQWSKGIPRTINVICDNVLLSGFAAQCRPADVSLVREVCRDFDFESPVPTYGVTERPVPVDVPSALEEPVRSLLERPRKAAQAAAGNGAEGHGQPNVATLPVPVEGPLNNELFAQVARRRKFLFF